MEPTTSSQSIPQPHSTLDDALHDDGVESLTPTATAAPALLQPIPVPALVASAAMGITEVASTATALSGFTPAPEEAAPSSSSATAVVEMVPAASEVAVMAVATATNASPNAAASAADEDDEDPVTDARRNWGHDVTLKLVKIWRRVCQAHPSVGRVARMTLVYDEFQVAIDCTNRSRKAVEDKLYTIKQMYHFIVKMNGNFKQGHRRRLPTWFELTKEERRAVRSLHRIRIPNISLEVFQVVDSVLNPAPLQATHPVADTKSSATMPTLIGPDESGERMVKDGGGSSVEVVDNKRNWSHEVTLQLARAWHAVVREHRDLRGAMLSQRVFNEFMNIVGGCSRSRKAIEDKMHSMKEMYRFITQHDASCTPASGKMPWFQLSKPERRQIRAAHKIRVPNLTTEVFDELATFMTTTQLDANDAQPIANDNSVSAVDVTTLSHQKSPSTNGTRQSGVGLELGPHLGIMEAAGLEAMRRLAEEESEYFQTYDGSLSVEALSQPAIKRPRVGMPPLEPTPIQLTAHNTSTTRTPPTSTDLLLHRLIALQEQTIAEQRQHHLEQLMLLRDISQRLPPAPGPHHHHHQHAQLHPNGANPI